MAFLDNNNCCSKCIKEHKIEINRKYNYQDVKQIFIKNNCELITKIYNNKNQKLEFICNNHKELGVQETTLQYINVKGYVCNYCKAKIANNFGTVHNIEFIKNEFLLNNFILEDCKKI